MTVSSWAIEITKRKCMGFTTFTFVVPAWYVTKSDDDLIRDCTKIVQSMLKNEVWTRGFDYGYSGALKGVKPDDILKVQVTVTKLKEQHCGQSLAATIPRFVPGFKKSQARKLLWTGWRQNYLVTTIELARSFNESDKSNLSMEYVSTFHQAVAINKEVSALIKAALQLVFHCTHLPMHSSEERRAFGLVFIKSGGGLHVESSPSTTHTYPAILEPESTSDFEFVFQLLADRWHFPLWPVHRFLKALPDSFADVEGILDLLFALEGLFEKNASSDFMRLTCAVLCSQRVSNARKVDEILKKAFLIRNEIVHGGKSYTGLEKHKASTGEKISWEIFWDLKTIVAGMIRLALEKLAASPDMRNLRILSDDVLARVFRRK